MNWNLRNNKNKIVSNGVYLVKINAKREENIVSSPFIKVAVLKAKGINSATFLSDGTGNISVDASVKNINIQSAKIYLSKTSSILPNLLNEMDNISGLYNKIIANAVYNTSPTISKSKRSVSARFSFSEPGKYSVLLELQDKTGKLFYQDDMIFVDGLVEDKCKDLSVSNWHSNDKNANRINLVFMGIGYSNINTVKELAKSIIDYNGTNKGLFYFEPFNNSYNKNKFNFWYIDEIGVVSPTWSLELERERLQNYCLVKNYYSVVLVNEPFRSYAFFGPNAHTAISWLENGSSQKIVAVHELGHLIGNLNDEYIEYIKPPISMRDNWTKSNIYTEYGGNDVSIQSCASNTWWSYRVGQGCGYSSQVDCIKSAIFIKYTFMGQNPVSGVSSTDRPGVKQCDWGVPCYVKSNNQDCDLMQSNCYTKDKCDSNDSSFSCNSGYSLSSLQCYQGYDCFKEVFCFEGVSFSLFDYFKPTFSSLMKDCKMADTLYQQAFGLVNIDLIQSKLDDYY